jgi:hypothetical protein
MKRVGDGKKPFWFVRMGCSPHTRPRPISCTYCGRKSWPLVPSSLPSSPDPCA